MKCRLPAEIRVCRDSGDGGVIFKPELEPFSTFVVVILRRVGILTRTGDSCISVILALLWVGGLKLIVPVIF